MTQVLVFVSGAPGTGKSTVAQRLAAELAMPLLMKDVIKESLAESLGFESREDSATLGRAAIDLLLRLIERSAADGVSAIFESNFYPDRHTERLRGLDRATVEVHCVCDPAALARRNVGRERHPVHFWGDQQSTDIEGARAWMARNGPLHIGGEFVQVDTTDSQPVDLSHIVELIRGMRDGL